MKRTICILFFLVIVKALQADTSTISLNIQRSESIKDQDLGKALEYALIAVVEAQKSGDLVQRSRAFTQAGSICFYGGLFNRSVEYFGLALKNAELDGDLERMANSYFNLGGVQSILGDYNRSRELTELGYNTILKVHQQKEADVPPKIRFSYRNNMGLISMKGNKSEQAKAYFLDAIRLARQDSDQNNLSRAMLNLADLLMNTGHLDSAQWVLTEVVMHGETYGIRSGLSVAHSFLGDLSMKKSDQDQALSHYMAALFIARERKDEYVQERVSKNISNIFQSKGMADSALFYLNLHNSLAVSFEKSRARQSLMQLDLESRLREQERSSIRLIRIERTILGILAGGALGVLFFSLIRFRKRSALERMESELREEKLRLEKKLLQDALELKDKQLATQVIYSLQKNEMISELVSRIKETAAQSPEGQKGSLSKIIREIEINSTEPWKEFEQRFLEVHAGFYERLMAKYPDLTSNERRLCAFLRLDMSTKEISNLTGQSVKAITQARFRLRAKLGIENPENSLFEVLLQI